MIFVKINGRALIAFTKNQLDKNICRIIHLKVIANIQKKGAKSSFNLDAAPYLPRGNTTKHSRINM